MAPQLKSPSKQTRAETSAAAVAARPGEMLRSWLLAALVALVVARPLLPSEGVSWLGDGQPFVMLWLVVAAGYFVLALSEGGLARPLGAVDVGVIGLVLIAAASAWVGSRNRADEIELHLVSTGSPRLAINMLFEWLALGLVFLLTRQLVRTRREARALVAVMIALAAALSMYGFYQVFVGLPAARAEYAANPDEALRKADQWYPPNSPERLRFERRLASNEPMSTFALTNSLAAFLAPWLVIALGIAWSQFAGPRVGADDPPNHRGDSNQSAATRPSATAARSAPRCCSPRSW